MIAPALPSWGASLAIAYNTGMKELNQGAEAPLSVQRLIDAVGARLAERPKLARMFELCFTNTLEPTVTRLPDQTTFVFTGDIPAMWLRDSAAQVRPYLIPAATDADL